MSENQNVTCYIKNTSGQPLTFASQNLEWGKFRTSPPSQIEDGQIGSFKASGAKATAAGTEGTVTYRAAVDAIFSISFNIPYSGSNEGTFTCTGANCSTDFIFTQTDHTYSGDPVQFPTTGSSPTVYYLITKRDQTR